MEMGYVPDDPYAGYVDDDSELEYSEEESSEDDQECGFGGPSSKHDSHGSSDEFEREMDSEVMAVLKLMTSPAALQASATPSISTVKKQPDKSISKQGEHSGSRGDSQPSASTSEIKEQKEEEEEEVSYYDEIYFDSSSDEGSGGGEEVTGEDAEKKKKRRKKFRKLTNDELFYDPHMDEEDEKWVNRQRMAYHNVKVSQQLEQQKRLRTTTQGGISSEREEGTATMKDHTSRPDMVMPRSDAILTCPACMTTLCLDCQRHESYVNQYRAMFVLNCCVSRDDVLKYVPKADKRSRRRKRKKRKEEKEEAEEKKMEDIPQETEPEIYHPVCCRECNTEVAVFDKQEVFHFFNVLASAP